MSPHIKVIRCISIHALREEGDAPWCRPQTLLSDFYPRPPRGGRRPFSGSGCLRGSISIHALREEGDPRAPAGMPVRWRHFYPRPLRGGRRRPLRLHPPHTHISIHALREEGDRSHYAQIESGDKFLSTPSARRATALIVAWVDPFCRFLSTPSARRATILCLRDGDAAGDFYPRPPRGGRLHKSRNPKGKVQFLSTPSARRATSWRTGCTWT